MNSTNRLDWDGACRYRRGGSGSDSDATIAGTAAAVALSFFSEKGGERFLRRKTKRRGQREKEGGKMLRGGNGHQVIFNIKFNRPKINRGQKKELTPIYSRNIVANLLTISGVTCARAETHFRAG